ncbi:MAG: four helix bundle protein [Planctomycetaceae bacterium]|nr:four helix bundle protein [Planctomycetaceae bacterium]
MESNVQNQHAFALEDRLIEFGVRVITVVEALPDSRAGNHIAGQLIRSGTSPAPNYAEAQSAESRNDFIHKMKICLKELRETRVWLLMVQRKKMIDSAQRLKPLLGECEELIAIFVASIKTALHNKNSKAPNHNSANAN